jgi:hypothetical protein
MGQKLPRPTHAAMSALHPKADTALRSRGVRFGPTTDSRIARVAVERAVFSPPTSMALACRVEEPSTASKAAQDDLQWRPC